MITRLKALEHAKTQIGVEEIPKGSNWGEHVQKYLVSVGITFPAAWCAAFVYWCYKMAGSTQLPKTGGVLKMWNSSPAEIKSNKPNVGAIVIFDYGGGLGHAGIIESIEGKVLHTIEGNTNDEGIREGYEVCRKQRKSDDPKIKGYILPVS